MASKLVSELWVKHMNAQTARLRFKIRPFVNVAFVLGLFVSAAVIFQNGFVVVTMIGVVFYLYYYILHKMPVQLECPHCQRTIYSNTPWLCGNKLAHHRNDNVYEFPFLRKCEHCGHEPKSYECQYCRKIIFLTPEHSDIGFARCADIQEVKRPVPVMRCKGSR